MRTKELRCPAELKGGGEGGTVEAAFSVYRDAAGELVVDSDGDVVEPTAFRPGQEVGMCWSHDWSRIIGKGRVAVEPRRAVFTGEFFATPTAQEARETIRGLGSLCEWSFGFRVLDADRANVRGQSAQIIKSVELFEVSPCLVGANRQTATLAVKDGAAPATVDHADLRRIQRDVAASMRVLRLREMGLTGERPARGTPYGPRAAAKSAWLGHGQVALREVRPDELAPGKHAAAVALVRALRHRLALPPVVRVRWYKTTAVERTDVPVWIDDDDGYGGPGYQGVVFPSHPAEVWLHAARDGRQLAATIAHECKHVEQLAKRLPTDEEEAERFAALETGPYGLDYRGAWPAEWAEVVA